MRRTRSRHTLRGRAARNVLATVVAAFRSRRVSDRMHNIAETSLLCDGKRMGAVSHFLLIRVLMGESEMVRTQPVFVGNIPDQHYDRGLGPVGFVGLADDMARRSGSPPVARVVERLPVLGSEPSPADVLHVMQQLRD